MTLPDTNSGCDALIERVAMAIYLHMFPERDSRFWHEREAEGDLRQNYMGAAKAALKETFKDVAAKIGDELEKQNRRQDYAQSTEVFDSACNQIAAYEKALQIIEAEKING